MKNKLIKRLGNWADVKDACRTTINQDDNGKEPSSKWKRRILLSEHSPIRILSYISVWEDLKSWVSVHLVRHKYGIEHFVSTRRTDRTVIDRNNLKQSERVSHKTIANAQAIINISRKRLCQQASKETREAWIAYLVEISEVDEELFSVCVPDCVYRGHCYEFKSCGYHKTKAFEIRLAKHKEGIN